MNRESLQRKLIKDSGNIRIFAGVFLVTIIAKLIVSALENIIIVYAGIRFFRVLALITMVLLLIGGALFLIYISLMLKTYFQLKKQEAIDEADNKTGPVLKVKGDLDPVQIRNNLVSETEKWMATISKMYPQEKGEMNVALTGVRDTMIQMDDYQLRLKNLLDSNGADALRDTEEVLDRVEQHICRNVRKLLNIMTVSSPNTKNDLDVVELTAKNCAEDNNKLLKTTKEFIVAVTEFLNSQGDSGSGINEIEVYKKALTTQIEEGGIY